MKRSFSLVGAFGGFLLVALWLTWPLAWVCDGAIVGGRVAQTDGWQNVWNLWWVRTALLHGQNPLFTDLLYWPQGVPLGFQTLNITNALLTLPVLLGAGPLPAYGVAALLGFALSGFFTFVLAYRVTGSWVAGVVAGLVVEAAPPHVARFFDGQLEHVTLQWVPLYVLALLVARERPGRREGLWLGLCAALVAYTSWYHAIHLAFLTVVFYGWHIVASRHRGWWQATAHLLRPWLVALPVLALLLLPAFSGFVAGLSDAARNAAHWNTQATFYRIDLLDLLLPGALHPLWGQAVMEYQQMLHPKGGAWIVAPGYTTLVLATLGMVRCWRQARLWALLAGVLLLYGFGGWLRVNGQETGIPLPFALVSLVPGVNFGHRRNLAMLPTLVPLAMLAAYGMLAVRERLRGWRRGGASVVLVGMMLFEFAPPSLPVLRSQPSPVYADLQHAPGALLILPIGGTAQSRMSAPLRDQMVHGRPIIGGYVARPPDYPMVRGVPFFAQAERRTCERAAIVPHDQESIQALLASYDISHIVLHADRMSERSLRCVRDLLEQTANLEPSRQVGSVTVYDVPEREPTPFLFPGDGWYAVEVEGRRTWRWMKERGEFFVVNPDEAPRPLALEFALQSFDRPRPVTLSLDGRSPGQITVRPDQRRVYRLYVVVESGQHLLRLMAPTSDDSDPRLSRPISIVVEGAEVREVGRQ